MNLKPRRTEEPEVNITSLIDVVLMLLVFFMLSTTFVKNADIRIELPHATAPPSAANAQPLAVTIDAKGHYYVGRQRLDSDDSATLQRALAAAAGGRFDQPLTIRADARTSHQSVVTVMDVAGKLGFAQLNIVTTHDGS